ncbi:hypothetical protein DY000_02062560 [Brassica cretica]|uniref:Histone-lysine N-methyltransferase n=1 Tax=Brassica cretica TaxID=69181 RepID=A0ABQ7ANG6_BRACR|nr:hypothetical protein DY000_02062560 [Brassica cretica]
MCLVGLHMQTMAGIDYITSKAAGADEEPLATSIVSAGRYDGEAQDPESLIYSGQGGNADKNKQASDQKLERGNLALERSLRKGNGVRVIRGEEDPASKTGKIYIYDGLYTISESWVEKGKSGCNTFKYRLVRVPGQPPAFGFWKAVHKWKEGLMTPRRGLILPDITSGVESKPVSLVNDFDDEKGPSYFTYISTLKHTEAFRITQQHPATGCSCRGLCAPDELPEEFNLPAPLLISAKNFGNVARFMNHSCSPNVLWQPVICEGNGEPVVHIAFFAIRHIPPMAELTYDYGVSLTSEARDGSLLHGKRQCNCGSVKCRGSFG